MLIQSITQRLHELSAMLSATDTLTAEQAYTIASFFRDFGDTNAVINEAVTMANSDADQLYANAQSLISAITEYEGTDRHALLNTDFKQIVDAHINSFEAPQKEAQARATELHHKWQEMSNRLDYLDSSTEEYKQLDAECDLAKQAYDKASEENTLLYNRCRAEKRRASMPSYSSPLRRASNCSCQNSSRLQRVSSVT